MKPRLVLTLLLTAILDPAILGPAILAQATRAAAGELAGVYLAKNATDYRIEFLADGTYYSANPQGNGEGTYTRTNDTLTCTDKEDGEKTEFALKGDHLIDSLKNPWVRRETLVKFPWKETVPTAFVVVDDKTRAPITEFAYTYQIKTPTAEFDPLLVRPITVKSPQGAFWLLAPKSCEVKLHVEGGMVIGGYPRSKKYVLTDSMKERRIEAPVSIGVLVEGEVVDAHTKSPVAGAIVSPLIFTPPGMSPDVTRSVKTDPQGRFKVRGVDPSNGIKVSHPDFLEVNQGVRDVGQKALGKTYTARVELEQGETIAGSVKDPSGKPLAGATVSDGAGKTVQTWTDGSFTLRGPRAWDFQKYHLSFERDAYLTKDLLQKPPVKAPLSIVLEQQPALTGKVVGPDGRSVAHFTVVAGPGQEPRDWCCSSQTVAEANGQFSVRIRTDFDYGKEGKVWMAVKAPNLAMWEAVVDSWPGTKAVTVQLKPGVSVRGSIKTAKASRQIVASLLPVRLHKEDFTNENSRRQELGRMQAEVDERGAFRFDHVAAGAYILAASGPGLSPVSTPLTVGTDEVDAGALTTKGRGTIVGLVYEAKMLCEGGICRLDPKRGLWAFAEGHISFGDSTGRSNEKEFEHLKPIPFKTDEHGRFRLDNVPVGVVSVNIPFNATADIISAHSRMARVIEGERTEVRFFEPTRSWDLSCHFVIGDGSPSQFSTGTGKAARRKVENVTTRPPMFRVELVPQETQPVSYPEPDWQQMDERNDIVLSDVHPGRYHVVISDWLMSRGFLATLAEHDVEVQPQHSTLTVPLGAGCITGAVQWSKEFRYMVHVLAVGKRGGLIHHARCDREGNFCVRYLAPDEYTLYAHDEKAGWCELPKVTVANDVHDVNSHELVAGGTITGRLPPGVVADSSTTVMATDPRGIAIEISESGGAAAKEFTLPSLWPGKWTVSVMKKHHLLTSKTVELRGTESLRCDFASR